MRRHAIRSLALLAAVAAVAAVAVLPAVAAAQDPSPAEILGRMEKTLNGFTDQFMSATMTIIDVDGSKKSYDFTTHQKGDKMRLVRFTSGENKGLATLVEERNRVYVYLPGMKKVRRVAAHGMNQSFGGSDFSNDDMAAVSWVAWYDATLLKADDSHYHLNCTPKAGYDSAYSKAIVKVNRKTFHQDGIEYYNKAGEKVKTFENGSPKEFAGGLRNSLVVVTDSRSGHKTRLDIHEFKANQGLPDSMFTQRELEWGR